MIQDSSTLPVLNENVIYIVYIDTVAFAVTIAFRLFDIEPCIKVFSAQSGWRAISPQVS